VAFGVAGCGAEPPASDRFTLRDSAGVAIAVSTAPAWEDDPGARWVIDTVPRLDLTTTGAGPEHEFYRAVDGTVLADGRIVIANAGSSEVRVYDEDGRFLQAAGREGEGPGEFNQISVLGVLPGDTLAVFSWPDRWTILAPDLSVVRMTNLGVRAWNPMTLGAREVATVELFASMLEHEGGTGLIRPPAAVVKRDAGSGEVLDTLWSGPGYEELMVIEGERRLGMSPFFGKGPAYDTHDGQLWVGASDAMTYRVIGADGSLLRIVQVPTYDLTVTPEMMEREREGYLGADPSPRLRRLLGLLPEPDTRPAYRDFFVDSEGHLWAGGLRTRTNYDDPWAFEIFGPEGEWLGSLEVPARFDLFEVGPDYLLGSRRDALDVEHVQLLPLLRSPKLR
jgi:hypothetical protein